MVDKWLSKYGGIIDATPEEIRSNPVWYFHNGTIRTADKNLEVQAKIHKQSVLDMLGTHNETRTKYDFVKSKILTWVEDRFGGNLADMVEGSALIQTRDPFKFARGFAFHLKIGLFNPVHYFLNAQSAAHGAFIVGDWKVVGKGLTGYHGSRMLMVNKHQEPFVRSVVKKMGYDPDDFMYAHQSMLERGINRVEGDHILMDNHLEYDVFKTKTGEFLDKGTFFFKEGELIPRMEAWHMAWNEARKKKPTGKFTRSELEAISSRQDDLANNMTRKSASNLQQGWTSNATQFWSWQMRLMESMLGDRLTGPEKARLMVGYAAMYGLPGLTSAVGSIPTGVIGAVSSTVGVDPGLLGSTDHYADIKKMALDRGIDVDTGVLSVLMDGLVSKGIETALGKDTNWSQRMGPGGILLFELMSKNEAGIFDVIGGAGFQVLKDAFNKIAPLTNSAVRMIGGDQEFNSTRIWEDFLHALSPISSVSNSRLMVDIARMGEYRFRSGTLAQKDLDIGDAVLVGMGLSPQPIPDAFIKSEILTDARGGKQKVDNVVKNYLAEHKRQVALAVKHYANGNLEAHKSYEESASAIAELVRTIYPEQAFKLGFAFKNESMVEQIGRDFSVYRSKKEAKKEAK